VKVQNLYWELVKGPVGLQAYLDSINSTSSSLKIADDTPKEIALEIAPVKSWFLTFIGGPHEAKKEDKKASRSFMHSKDNKLGVNLFSNVLHVLRGLRIG
jgi:hypothetical protein